MTVTLGLLASLVSIEASASITTGNGELLLDNCFYMVGDDGDTARPGGDIRSYVGSGACAGLVQGAMEPMILFNHKLPPKSRICVPDDLSTNVAVKIVYKFLKQNPGLRNEPETALVLLALKKPYPCQ